MADVTAIILTKNEEQNITDCLESIKGFCQRAVVIDSGSTDKTVEIAKNLGADVYTHAFENYARQFNWGIDNTGINTKWTLRLDADERLTPALCRELCALINKHENNDINGITMQADYYFLGRHISHGRAKKRKLMLFKTGVGRIEDRRMDEHTILSEGSSVAAKEKFLHYDFKSLSTYIAKLNWYATREMQDYYEYKMNLCSTELNDKKLNDVRKKKFGFYYKLPMFIRSLALFIYVYIFRLGFLDGREGYIYCYLYSRWYRFLVDAKIYEQEITGNPFEETGDLKL